MKTKLIKSGMVLAGLGSVAVAARAQDDAWSRIGVSYRAGFNISASFSGLGGYTSPNNPGAPGQITGDPGTVVRTYDDGFIGIDISGNAGGRTTYWGYDSDWRQTVGDTVQMHNSSSPATARTGSVDDGAQHGIELNYFQRLGGGEKWHWGIEAAFNWMDICIHDNRTLAGNVMTVTHLFNLNGVLPPVTPPVYEGPVDGPGAPQLSDNAVDLSGPTQIGVATINGKRSLAASLYGFRLGPYVEVPLGKRVSVALGGGFSLGVIDSEFSYAESVTIPDIGTQSHAAKSHSTDCIYGGYIRGQVKVKLCKAASLFGSAEFNSLSSFTQSAGAAKANLDLSSGVYVSGGISFNF